MEQKSQPGRFDADNSNMNNPDQSANLVPHNLTSNNTTVPGLMTEQRRNKNRRNGVLKAFVYGNFRPRRRVSRRAADQHHFWFDWHEPRILYLALGVLLLSCTDALFTLNLLNAGASEANAFMASMLDFGIDRFVISKISFTALSLVALVAAARRKFLGTFSVEHLLQALFVGYLLLICYEVYLFIYVFKLSLN